MVAVALFVAGTLSAAAGSGPATAGLSVPSGAAASADHFEYRDGSVLVHLPPKPATTAVVVLHSLGSGASEAESQGWSELADREGFIGVYPERGTSWNAGLCCGDAAAADRDDVSWLAGVLAEIRSRYGLRRVLLTGFSNGGMMAERLVAERPASTDGFAVWGAAPEMPVAGSWAGRGTAFTGVYDNIVPAQGGRIRIGGRWTVVRPAAQTRSYLPEAALTFVSVAGKGHAVPDDWPERAWRALTSAAG